MDCVHTESSVLKRPALCPTWIKIRIAAPQYKCRHLPRNKFLPAFLTAPGRCNMSIMCKITVKSHFRGGFDFHCLHGCSKSKMLLLVMQCVQVQCPDEGSDES